MRTKGRGWPVSQDSTPTPQHLEPCERVHPGRRQALHTGTLLPPSPRLEPCALGGVWGAFLFLIMYRLGVTSPVLAPAGTLQSKHSCHFGEMTPSSQEKLRLTRNSPLPRSDGLLHQWRLLPVPRLSGEKASGQMKRRRGQDREASTETKRPGRYQRGRKEARGSRRRGSPFLCASTSWWSVTHNYSQAPQKQGHPRPSLQHRSASGDGLWDSSY